MTDRERAFELLRKGHELDNENKAIIIDALGGMQKRTGHWIEGKYKDTCDKCRCTYPKNIGFKNFCPNCGVRMVEPQKSEGEE